MGGSPDWRTLPPVSLSPILEAALAAFHESGFHGASVRGMAGRVGMTVPMLYYYHDSKDGLLLAVLIQTTESIAWRVELAERDGVTPSERLQHVVEAIVLSMTLDPRVAAIDTSESRYLSAESRSKYVEVRDRIEKVMRKVADDGVDSGDFAVRDAAEVVRAILGMLQAIPRWYQAGGKDTPEQVVEDYTTLVMRMVGATGEVQTRPGRLA